MPFPRGKTGPPPAFRMAGGRQGDRQVARADSFIISFHTFTPGCGPHLVHILFTPAVFVPAQRLQIRNHMPRDKKKSELYFPFSIRKFLTIKLLGQGSNFLSCALQRGTNRFVRRKAARFLRRKYSCGWERGRGAKGFARRPFCPKFAPRKDDGSLEKKRLRERALAICLAPRRSLVSRAIRERAAALQEHLRPLTLRSAVYNLGTR